VFVVGAAVAPGWAGCSTNEAESRRDGTPDAGGAAPDSGGAAPDSGGATPDARPGTGNTSGLPGNLNLGDATEAERRRYCEHYVKQRYSPEAVEVMCLLDASGTSDCLRRSIVCTEQTNVAVRAGLVTDDCVDDLRLGCSSTVAEAERCALSVSQAFTKLSRDLSCDSPNIFDAIFDSSLLQSQCLGGPCPEVPSGDRCCSASDPCFYANDGWCDCPDQPWDANDCSGQDCCGANDPCSFANDGWCDCPDQSWDTADCSSAGCCGANDPCSFANDGWCDCPDQPWDAADCSSVGCCGANDPCGFANDGYCDCPTARWDRLDCAPCCTADNTCGWDRDGYCDCPGQPWEAPDCAPDADGGVPDGGVSKDAEPGGGPGSDASARGGGGG
jgi:hypothetical protein